MQVMSTESPPNACVLIIGNEILSGKTQDTNLQFLGSELALRGVRLAEARVLPDDKAEIVAALNKCRARYTYVITTGGIGPTHDDITAECVAAAFDREFVLNEEAAARLRRSGHELNPARLKMAHVPEGATLIDNPLSNAPGFRVENVFVLAGIPSVARAMFSTSTTSTYPACSGSLTRAISMVSDRPRAISRFIKSSSAIDSAIIGAPRCVANGADVSVGSGDSDELRFRDPWFAG